jgi:hypothetical protein
MKAIKRRRLNLPANATRTSEGIASLRAEWGAPGEDGHEAHPIVSQPSPRTEDGRGNSRLLKPSPRGQCVLALDQTVGL